MVKQLCVTSILLIFINFSGFCQEIQVKGEFLKDTVKIGEETPFSMSVTYPRAYDVIFPDSLYRFDPFEYTTRSYYPTKSDSINSFDSVVYFLSTFEMDCVQYLQLPIFLKQEEDSALIYTAPDSIILFHVIEELPDSLKLIENTSFFKVSKNFNYPIFLAISAIFVIVMLAIFIFYGNKLSRWIRIYIMKRNHKKFINSFYSILGSLKDNKIGTDPELAILEWKKYMEKLEKEPYTKLTSKELINLHADQRLKENLRSIDRFIYGDVKDRPLHENFEKLLEFTVERYEVRLKEVIDG